MKALFHIKNKKIDKNNIFSDFFLLQKNKFGKYIHWGCLQVNIYIGDIYRGSPFQ